MGGGTAKPWIHCLAPATCAHTQGFCPLPGRRSTCQGSTPFLAVGRSGPFAGSGIKYAIEDAVVTANLLTEPLKAGSLCLRDLAEVQRRREWPTRVIQALGAVVLGQLQPDVRKPRPRSSRNSDHCAKCFLALA